MKPRNNSVKEKAILKEYCNYFGKTLDEMVPTIIEEYGEPVFDEVLVRQSGERWGLHQRQFSETDALRTVYTLSDKLPAHLWVAKLSFPSPSTGKFRIGVFFTDPIKTGGSAGCSTFEEYDSFFAALGRAASLLNIDDVFYYDPVKDEVLSKTKVMAASKRMFRALALIERKRGRR